ncbi:MAG: hypothetical protein AAF747_09425 [Planctomycetota bacterium]
MDWLSRLRFRVFAFLIGVTLTAVAMLSWFAWPAAVVVTGAITAAAVCVNTMTAKLRQHRCHGCGTNIEGTAAGTYGVVCPSCGAINSDRRLASMSPESPAGEAPNANEQA